MPGPVPSRPVPGSTTSATTARGLPTTGHGSGSEETALPVVQLPPPVSRIQADPTMRKSHRVCAGCGTQLGGSGPAEGECPNCGKPYFFSPKLGKGDLVAGQYEVEGCITHGGFGWIYLAVDRNLDNRYVVLKGLIDSGDTAAARLAVAESRVLAASEHLNIVRIYNVVTHPDPHEPGERNRYIVMDFVGGISLHEMMTGHAGELRAEHVANYGREILAALGYLHEQGLLYCDMSPQNVIQGERRVKVIDLGAIREIDDHTSPIVGTPDYRVSAAEIARYGLTVRSDLYSVGATLKALLEVSVDGIHPRKEIEFGVRSLRHVLSRATSGFEQRYPGTADMAAQLDGVLAELHSLRDGRPRPALSSLFGDTVALLDDGLGQPPPLEEWLELETPGFTDGRPSASSAVSALPVPTPDPKSTVEDALRDSRVRLARADHDGAEGSLQRAQTEHGDGAHHNWRMLWHRALLMLAKADFAAAGELFGEVYWQLPGEQAPKIALGYCAESRRETEAAERFYTAVWTRDRSQVSAAFGLARIHLSRDARMKAVAVLDEVPEASRHYDAAAIAAIRILVATLPNGAPPGTTDLQAARKRLEELYLDSEEARDRLTTLVREAELALSGPRRERQLRSTLAETYRKLARQARTRNEHGVLVDRANEVRPRTRFENE